MKVICTRTEKYVLGEKSGGISIHRGSIYNVVRIESAEDIIKKYSNLTVSGLSPASGDWYELLEVEGFHHSCNFLELPDDLFETEMTEKKLEEVK